MKRSGLVLSFFVVPALVAIPSPAQPERSEEALSVIRPAPLRPSRWDVAPDSRCYSRQEGSDGVIAQARICDGPRRVPAETTEASRARALRLGLGRRPAVDRLRIGTPPTDWVAQAPGPPPPDLLWPVAWGLFSRGFGLVRRSEIHERPHNGVDIVAPEGTHIRAAHHGLVVYADNHVRGFGNLVALLHRDGTSTFYAHCRALYVTAGQRVRRGQSIGEVGATGLPVRAHLHFEWRRRGRPLDPMDHFVERPDPRQVRIGERFTTIPLNVRP